MSECSSQYVTSEYSEGVRYQLEHEKIKIRIHKWACNILFVISIETNELLINC